MAGSLSSKWLINKVFVGLMFFCWSTEEEKSDAEDFFPPAPCKRNIRLNKQKNVGERAY